MEKLVLIDGNAILHRAFHALPPMNHKGVPTNAVYGFFTMLFKIIEDLRPAYLIVCFDRAAPTFRKQMYVGYQATRPALSDDLSPQFEMTDKALDSAKIVRFGIDGYEADDLIGTLSVQATKKGIQTIIVSGDRDLLQLVNNKVLMIAPITGMTKMTLFDEVKVKEKYGLEPHQIIDYKALVGDASDNYPGVGGIGPKGAANLLNKYQTLENIYKHISDLPIGLQEKLAQDAEQSALAKKLATIICDAPLTFDESTAEISKIDTKGLDKSFEGFGFNTIRNRLTKIEQIAKSQNEKSTNKTKEEKRKDNGQMNLL